MEQPFGSTPQTVGRTGTVIITALITALVVGFGTYWFTKPASAPTVSITPSASVDVNGLKTYTDTTIGYLVKYPAYLHVPERQTLFLEDAEYELYTSGTDANLKLISIVYYHAGQEPPMPKATTEHPVIALPSITSQDAVFKGVQYDSPEYEMGAEKPTIVGYTPAIQYTATINTNVYVFTYGNFRVNDGGMLDQKISDFKAIVKSFTLASSGADTTGWKTYTNTQYGFEIKYPVSFRLSEEQSKKTESSPWNDWMSIHVGSATGTNNTSLDIGINQGSTTNVPTSCEEQGSTKVDQITIGGIAAEVCRADEPDDRNSVTLIKPIPDGAYTFQFWCWYPKNNTTCKQILSTFRFTK